MTESMDIISRKPHTPYRVSQAQRAALRRRRQRLKEQGLCVTCGQRPSQTGKSQYCAECQQRQKDSMRQCEQRKREQGICLQCPDPVPPGQKLCRGCLDRCKRQQQKRLKRYREEGKCISCGQPRDREGRLSCAACAAKAKERDQRNRAAISEYGKERRWSLLAQGLCGCCGKQPTRDGTTLCETCIQKSSDKTTKLIQLRRLQHLCIRCGSPDLATTTRCEACRRYVNEKQRRRYVLLDAACLCYKCGQHPQSALGGKICDGCRNKTRKNPARRNHPRPPPDPNIPKRPRGRPCDISTAGQRLWKQVYQQPWWCGQGVGKANPDGSGADVIILYVGHGETTQARSWWDAHPGPWSRWSVRIIETGKVSG